MKRLLQSVIVISLLSLASLSTAELSNYRAEIEATRHGALDLKAKGDIEFSMTETGNWTLLLDIKGGPLRHKEVSIGNTGNLGYQPNQYQQRTKFLFVKENIDWLFNWNEKKITGTVKKDDYEFPLNSVIHDPLSFQLPLRAALISGQQTSFSYRYMRYSRPDDIRFEIIGEELLSLESGRIHTFILKQTKPLKPDEKKLIWVAKDYDFIPVRYTTYKEDKIKDDMIVQKLWINNQPVTLSP